MTEEGASLSVREILSETVSIFRKNMVIIVLAAVACGGVDGTVDLLFRNWLNWPDGLILHILLGYFVLNSLLAKEGLGSPGRAGQVIVAFAILWVLTSIAVFAGMMLVIFPGIILMARWSISGALVIGEGAGPLAAMRQSWQATSRYQGEIAVAQFVLILVFFAVFLAQEPIETFIVGPDVKWPDAANEPFKYLTGMLIYLYSGAGSAMTVALYRLLARRDGAGATGIAQAT